MVIINLLLLLLSAALASTESAYCNQNLTIIGISNTTVAVKWDSEIGAGTRITYRVNYYKKNSILSRRQVSTMLNGLLLEGLTPATTYEINIFARSTTISPSSSLSSIKLLCNTTFTTQDQSRQYAVEGVRAHVFYPFVNNNSIISAAVVWKSLSEISNYSIKYYNIRVLTLYDADIPSKDFNETFFIVSKNSTFIKLHSFIEILDFPLSTNALYILQIQGVLESGKTLPFSEPIEINTSYARPAEELYALFPTDGSSYLIQGNSQPEGSFDTSSPIAMDKTRRIIYYNDDNDIKRLWLNNNEPPQIVFEGEGLGITVHSLAYDWVEDILYIGGNKDEDLLVLLRVRISDGKSSIIYQSTMSSNPVEMTVNPFTGFLHFITGKDIVRFNLRNNTSTVVNSTQIQTLAEDVSSNCLYFMKEAENGRNYIVSINTITGLENDDCSFVYPITKTVRLDSRIAVDDTGIYLITRDRDDQDVNFPLTFYTFNNALGTDVGFFGVDENKTPSYILTTSPGTQPIPRFQCLSPDLSDIANRPHITNYTVTDESTEYISISLTWSKPELPHECYDSYFSLPPLTYRVFLNRREGLETKLQEYENGKIFYDTTSAVITGISKGIELLVSVSAMNQYTTRSSNDLLKGPQLILQEQDNLSSATPLVSKTISASPTSIQITTPTNPGSSSSDAVLIGSIAGAGGGIALILGLVIATAIILAVLIKRRNKKSIDLKTPPPPPPSSDLQPYAVPIDSLEEYRKNGGKLPPLPPQNYEVPSVSIGHTTEADEPYSTVLPLKGSPDAKSMSPIETETYSSPLSSPKHAKSKYSTISCQMNPSYTKVEKTINTRNGIATLRPPNPYSQPISTKKTPPTSPSTSPTHSLEVPSPYSDPVSIKGTTPPRNSALSLNVAPSPYSEPVKTKRSPSSNNETDEDEYYEPILPVRPASSTNVGHHYFTLNPTAARPSSYSPSSPLPPVPVNSNNNGSIEQPLYSEVGGTGDRKN